MKYHPLLHELGDQLLADLRTVAGQNVRHSAAVSQQLSIAGGVAVVHVQHIAGIVDVQIIAQLAVVLELIVLVDVVDQHSWWLVVLVTAHAVIVVVQTVGGLLFVQFGGGGRNPTVGDPVFRMCLLAELRFALHDVNVCVDRVNTISLNVCDRRLTLVAHG